MTDRKFDIFEVIEKIKSNDRAYFDNLEDYEVRQIYPFVLMRWLSGTKNPTQLKLGNDLANTVCFQLYKHPRLLYKLLMASNVDKNKRSFWVKKKSKTKDSEVMKVIKNYYECSTEEAKDIHKLLTVDDIIDIAELIGTEKETLTKLKKELNGK